MKVFTVHVKATYSDGKPVFDGIRVAKDRDAVVKAFNAFREDPIQWFFLNPNSSPWVADLWNWLAERLAAYENEEKSLITKELNGYKYTVAVESTEVIE